MNTIYHHLLYMNDQYIRRSIVIITLTFAWFGGIFVLAVNNGFNSTVSGFPLVTVAAVTVPVLSFILAFSLSGSVREWVYGLDIRPLILLHTFRMLGLGFLFLYYHQMLPGRFAWPAGLGDAIAAAGAFFLGVGLYSNKPVHRFWILAWNSFGLLDFIVALAAGITSRTVLLYSAANAPSDPMGTFPLALIPGFVVPFYIITHLIIFIRARK